MFRNTDNTWKSDDHLSLKYEIFNLKSKIAKLEKENSKLNHEKTKAKTAPRKIPKELESLMETVDDDNLRRKAENFLAHLTCVVCNTNLKRVLYLDCRHLTACIACAEKLTNTCPICRQLSTKKITVFH